MANSERALSLTKHLPESLEYSDAIQLLILQLGKDLQISIESKDPEAILSFVAEHLAISASDGSLMGMLYRVDLNESLSQKLLAKEDWQGLAMAVVKRTALKVSLRHSQKT